MSFDRVQVYCERSFRMNRIDLFLVRQNLETGKKSVGTSIVMEAIHENAAFPAQPTMELPPTAAQQLMDELWRCGIRPSEGQGSAGALAATQDHLKDMQRLGFTLLDQLGRPKE